MKLALRLLGVPLHFAQARLHLPKRPLELLRMLDQLLDGSPSIVGQLGHQHLGNDLQLGRLCLCPDDLQQLVLLLLLLCDELEPA